MEPRWGGGKTGRTELPHPPVPCRAAVGACSDLPVALTWAQAMALSPSTPLSPRPPRSSDTHQPGRRPGPRGPVRGALGQRSPKPASQLITRLHPDCGRSTPRRQEGTQTGPGQVCTLPEGGKPKERPKASAGWGPEQRRAQQPRRPHPGRDQGPLELLGTQTDRHKKPRQLTNSSRGGSKSGHFHIGTARKHKAWLV